MRIIQPNTGLKSNHPVIAAHLFLLLPTGIQMCEFSSMGSFLKLYLNSINL